MCSYGALTCLFVIPSVELIHTVLSTTIRELMTCDYEGTQRCLKECDMWYIIESFKAI